MSESQLHIILLKFVYSYPGFIHLMGHFNEKQVKERNNGV